MGVQANKHITLYNLTLLSDDQSNEPARRRDEIVYYARIEKLKGIDTLIAVARLTDRQLAIAGTCDYVPEMQEQIRGVANIRYLGFISGQPLQELLRSARDVVAPSEWYEPFGLTVIESKAISTPVICSRIGRIPELVQDGNDGILFKLGNVDELFRALRALANSYTDAMGITACADVEARFSPTAHLSDLTEIY